MSWILRLVKTGAEGEAQATDVMEIDRPDDLRDIANLGLTLAEAKLLLAALQQEIVAAQARTHAVLRPYCPCGGGVRHVKDYRKHPIATLFGQVTVRLPRFQCAACGTIEVGIDWPPSVRLQSQPQYSNKPPPIQRRRPHSSVAHHCGLIETSHANCCIETRSAPKGFRDVTI